MIPAVPLMNFSHFGLKSSARRCLSELVILSMKENKTIEQLLRKFDFKITSTHDGINEWVMKFDCKDMPSETNWLKNDCYSFRHYVIKSSHVIIVGEAHVKHQTDIINWDLLSKQESSIVLSEDQISDTSYSIIPYFNNNQHRNLPNLHLIQYDRRNLMNKNEDMHPYRRFFVEQTYENIPKTWSKGKFPYENIEEFKSKVQKLSEYDAITAHETFLLPEDRYKNIPSNTLKFFKSRKCNYDSITLDTCNADIPM